MGAPPYPRLHPKPAAASARTSRFQKALKRLAASQKLIKTKRSYRKSDVKEKKVKNVKKEKMPKANKATKSKTKDFGSKTKAAIRQSKTKEKSSRQRQLRPNYPMLT